MSDEGHMSSIDMSSTIDPNSDQLGADDFIAGPRTVTVTGVSKGNADQPVNIAVAEFDRPFRPCLSMRRVLVAAWGPDAGGYVGRRMTLYRDPAVKWGGQEIGGIRIKEMSHIDKRLSLALTVTRGKRVPFVIEPLTDTPPPETATNEQRTTITALLADQGLTSKDAALEWLSEQLNRPIVSTADLTGDEAEGVIGFLRAEHAKDAQVEDEAVQA